MNRRSLFAKIGSAFGLLATAGVATATSPQMHGPSRGAPVDKSQLNGDGHVVFEPALAGGFLARLKFLVLRDGSGDVIVIRKSDSPDVVGSGDSMRFAMEDLWRKIYALTDRKIYAIHLFDSYMNCGPYGFADVRTCGDGLLAYEEGAAAKRRLWQHKMGPSA